MYFTVQLGLFRPDHFRINQDYNNRNRGDEQCINYKKMPEPHPDATSCE